jgi:hypothetical protein
MPNENQWAGDSPNFLLAPALALGMLNPFLVGALRGNTQANEAFVAMADEWRDFVGRRIKEDVDLVRHLTDSRTPDQAMTAYADFWRKAADDYGKEVATMSKLMSDVATKMVASTQSATNKAGEEMFRPRRAA